MGGTVAETIRRENGEIIKMARRTGAYNWMIFSKDFMDGKIDKAINDHIEAFMDMKADYESGPPYKNNMSDVYGWCNHTAPTDYGLVVLDFQNKKIMSMQGFDTPGRLYGVNLSKEMVDLEDKENYEYFFQNNLFEVYTHENKHLGDVHSLFGSTNTLKNLQIEIDKSYDRNNSESEFLDKYNCKAQFLRFQPKFFNDFEMIRFKETPQGLIEFINKLQEEGFVFNDEEKKMWKEHYEDIDYLVGYDGKMTDEQIGELDEDAYQKYGQECLKAYQNDIDKAFKSIKKSNKP